MLSVRLTRAEGRNRLSRDSFPAEGARERRPERRKGESLAVAAAGPVPREKSAEGEGSAGRGRAEDGLSGGCRQRRNEACDVITRILETCRECDSPDVASHSSLSDPLTAVQIKIATNALASDDD